MTEVPQRSRRTDRHEHASRCLHSLVHLVHYG